MEIMTVEVKELTINASIVKPQTKYDNSPEKDGCLLISEEDKAEIVSECTKKVLDILRGMYER